MCRRVQCGTCGAPTYAGCGMHVEQVLADVPRAERCQGHAGERAAEASSPGWLGSLFGAKRGSGRGA